jgi:hypothetical protein
MKEQPLESLDKIWKRCVGVEEQNMGATTREGKATNAV